MRYGRAVAAATGRGLKSSSPITVRANEMLTAFLELETAIQACLRARVVALSRRPKGEIFRAVEPGRENDSLASRGKLQDITPSIPNGFRYEEITRRVKAFLPCK